MRDLEEALPVVVVMVAERPIPLADEDWVAANPVEADLTLELPL